MSQNEVLRVLIADDEAYARLRLLDLLSAQSASVETLEAEDGEIAVNKIRDWKPHLLFLDVQMPGLDGLEVVQAVGSDSMPITVFVTAYDDYAIRAFEANALDYLLKPFTDERFAQTFARAQNRLKETSDRSLELRIASMLSAVKERPRYLDRIAIKSAQKVQLVKTRQIDWIEADGVYVNIHANGSAWSHRATLIELERQLDPKYFIRVHRSALINIESIESLKPLSHGEFEIFLKNGARVKVSRQYRSNLEARLRQTL